MTTNQFLAKFFGVAIRRQTYLNLVYLSLAFPLGLIYFIVLVVGFSLGFALLIIWIGAFILAAMFAIWWALAAFERFLAISLLREDIAPMAAPMAAPIAALPGSWVAEAPAPSPSPTPGRGVWEQVKAHLGNPVTWKSLAFLAAKFPLGLLSFIALVICLAVVLACLAAPVVYPFFPIEIQWWGNAVSAIDTLWEAIVMFFLGVVLLFLALHLLNGLAWISGRFARVMLGNRLASSL